VDDPCLARPICSEETIMRQLIMAAVSALLLAACTTPQERAAQVKAEMERVIIEYGPACVTLGYPANTDPWRHCVMQLAAADDIYYYGYPSRLYGGYGRTYWGGGGLWGPYW
jgi:hypothetical protein